MTIFEIHDAAQITENMTDRVVGYLFYYERARRFYAEIPDGVDEWEAPAMFHGFVKRGKRSIDAEWSMKWVGQRIIPPDRQNLGAILRENGLHTYDEYKLLCLSEGRCAQDELYITRTEYDLLPEEIRGRLDRKVKDILPCRGNRVLVFFKDDTARRIELEPLFLENDRFGRIRREQELFLRVKVSPGGNGIEWGENYSIPAEWLYTAGEIAGVGYQDFVTYAKTRLVDTTGASELLGVSRQYLDQLVREGRLGPVLSGEKCRIFIRAELEGL